MDESDFMTNYSIACNYLEKNDFRNSLQHFDNILKVLPNDPKINFQVAHCLEKLQNYERASEFYQIVKIFFCF